MENNVFVYYDKTTGDIFSITNETSSRYEDAIQVPYSAAKLLLDGTHHFKDYIVNNRQQPDGSYKLVLETRLTARLALNDSDYVFKNKVFEWITESDADTDCVITWNLPQQSWQFSLSKRFKDTYNTVLPKKVVFFITLETDMDFLIRTISVDCDQLVQTGVNVVFENAAEYNIDKLAISSKLVFADYKLVKIYE
jgi:hypothetical protein